MIRRLELTPELLLHLHRGCVQVIADPVPEGARIVAYGANTHRDVFYVDIDSEAFITTEPLTPIMRRCEVCPGGTGI